MNTYTKLFTTNPPTVIKTFPPQPGLNVFCIFLLLIITGISVCAALVSGEAVGKQVRKSKQIFYKVFTFTMMTLFIIATVASLTFAVIIGVNLNKPTYRTVIAPNALRIEQAAIRQAHKEYPYVLTIDPSEDGSGSKHYLLKRKPHKDLADLYKLKFTENNNGNSKPYIKHIGYRSLPATRSCSVNNSTSYLHDKVINESNQGYLWEKPGKVLSGIEGLFEK